MSALPTWESDHHNGYHNGAPCSLCSLCRESDNALMSRDTNGTHVEVAYLPIMDIIVLGVNRGDVSRAVTVDPADAFDAFNHPALYIDAESAHILFDNTTPNG